MKLRSQRLLSGETSERVEKARQVLTVFERGWNRMKLLPAQHPQRLQDLTLIAKELEGFHASHGAMELTVLPESLLLEEQEVLHHEHAKENFLFRLYQDGVRRLLFLEGISTTELDLLVTLLLESLRGTSEEDDIVTLLWNHNPAHIKVKVIERFTQGHLELFSTSAATPSEDQLLVQTRTAYRSARSPQPTSPFIMAATNTPDPASQGILLPREALSNLAGETPDRGRAEPSAAEGKKLLALLRGMIELCGEPALSVSAVAITTFVIAALERNDLVAIQELLSLGGHQPQSSNEMMLHHTMRITLSNTEVIRKLLASLLADPGSKEHLALLKIVAEQGFSALFKQLVLLKHEQLKGYVLNQVQEHAGKQRGYLLKVAFGFEEAPAILALRTLQRIGIGDNPDLLLEGLRHPNPQVRYRVLALLRDCQGESFWKELTLLLRDPERTIRMAVLQRWKKQPHARMEFPLQLSLQSRDFLEWDLEEQTEVIKLYTRVVSPKGMTILRSMAFGEGEKVGKELRLLALKHLGECRDEPSLANLEKLGRSLFQPAEIKEAAKGAAHKIREGRDASIPEER